ncbi:MAG: PadR family transcriptional regulator [Clostridia bacterium]|nr:PadR family transcriptional regulator [Clostridia bacterium]
MEFIILGLLLLQSRSIYELRERIDKGINLMYSSSTGSIQAAIKKLLAAQHITFEMRVDNGREKKIYSITPQGIQHFMQWVNAPNETSNIKNPDLIKIYFMGFSDREVRERNIVLQIENLREILSTLELVWESAKITEVPESGRDIANYQLATLDYGIKSIRFNIGWYEDLLDKIRNGEI